MTLPAWWRRFWSKVNKTSSCWLWTSDVDATGYGRFWFEGRNAIAHVVLWEHYNGAVPDGQELMHACDVRNCVRPQCLSLGTHLENMESASRRARIPRRMSEDVARAVLAARESGETMTSLAERFDVSFWNVRDLLRGKTFRWLTQKG